MFLLSPNFSDRNASSPGKTLTQTSTETQPHIAVKSGILEEMQIEVAEGSHSQMADESEIFVLGNTGSTSPNESRTLTKECTETQVTAETQISSAYETKTRAVEATEPGATGTQATTESTNLAKGETQIQPPEETYTRTKTAEYRSTKATEHTDITETKTTEESKPSILNGKDISFCYITKTITILINLVIIVKGIVFPIF